MEFEEDRWNDTWMTEFQDCILNAEGRNYHLFKLFCYWKVFVLMGKSFIYCHKSEMLS